MFVDLKLTDCLKSINTGQVYDVRRNYFAKYFPDYNDEFRHSGIQFLSPSERHYGQEGKIMDQRNRIVETAYNENIHRYPSEPKRFSPITEVRIN